MGLKYLAYANTNDYGISSTDATYANARDGTGTLTATSTSGTGSLDVGQKLSAGIYTAAQAFYSFDTSGFPAGCSVHFLGVYNPVTGLPNLEIFEYAWSGSGTGNFRSGTALGSLTQLGSFTDSVGFDV